MKDLIVRPKKLDDFIGKDQLKKTLKIYINSSKLRNVALDHIIFYGWAGVGKTTLATVIANELNAKIHYIQGPSIEKISDILDMVSMINDNDIVFIDEAHKINHRYLETLYSIMEDFVVDVKIGKELNSQFSRLSLPKFTLICSTTNIGNLPSSFIDRFRIKFYLDLYTDSEIEAILNNLNTANNLSISTSDLKKIAMVSRGVPRVAINYLNSYHDYLIYDQFVSVERFFSEIGVFNSGLTDIDINYLKILFKNKSNHIGIKTICQELFIDEKTIENNIEPYLLKLSLIFKNNHGRKITSEGIKYLNSL